jgi:hypothetical protein
MTLKALRSGSSDLEVFVRGDADYDKACAAFNLAATVAPAEAVIARNEDQVEAAVRYAADNGLLVRVMSTGHGALSRGPMDEALLIRVELDDRVEIDPLARIARVPAGARWEEVVTAAAKHGLSALHGSSPTVGAVGYLLHGGLSFYGRRHGVAANLVRAIELVTASGNKIRIDTEHDDSLFWALRGGGGGFGVVTAVEIDLIEVAATFSGSLVWSAEHAADLVPAWRDWAASAPREITTSLRLVSGELPIVPDELAGRQSLWVSGTAVAGSSSEIGAAAQAVAELIKALGPIAHPAVNTWRRTTPVEVMRTHMDPESPVPVRSAHGLLDALSDGVIQDLVIAAGPSSGSPLLVAELRQLGGAFAVPALIGGAFDHLDAPWLYYAAGVAPNLAASAAASAQFAANAAALEPHTTPYTAPSFVEDASQHQYSFDAETARSVNAIRRRYDPVGLFRGDVASSRPRGVNS